MKAIERKVLIVDDDQEICTLLSEFLEQFHYDVTTVNSGRAMLKAMQESLFDIILLDIMLPMDNGFELCKKIREKQDVPIIIISALDQDSDRILGLEVGADDYLPKPFNTRELLARIKALLRRVNGDFQRGVVAQIVTFANWRLDRHRHILLDANNVATFLSNKEYLLLELFLEYPQQILTREQLMDKLYDRNFDCFDRSIDVLIGRLRKKIEPDAKSPEILKTIRGLGYQFSIKPSLPTRRGDVE